MTEATGTSCIFDACDVRGAHLGSATFAVSALVNCQFGMTDFFLTTFRECKLTGSTFADADLSQSVISGGDWANQWLSLRYVFAIFETLEHNEVAATLHGALENAGAMRARQTVNQQLEADDKGHRFQYRRDKEQRVDRTFVASQAEDRQGISNQHSDHSHGESHRGLAKRRHLFNGSFGYGLGSAVPRTYPRY
jgi:hypothetical protein